MKRMFIVLCFAVAAALLCGCGIIVRALNPPRVKPVFPPATRPIRTPEPEIPEQAAFTATPIPENTPCTFGETTYTITTELNEDYDYDWGTTHLSAQGGSGGDFEVYYDGYFAGAYYIETQGRSCVLLTTDLQVSESVMTYILDADSLAETDSLGGTVHSFDGDEVIMFSLIDVLGTYPTLRGYTFRSDLTMDPGENLFNIIKDEYFMEEDYYLVTTRDLQVQMFENGQYGSSEMLYPGSELCMTATDGTSIVYFKTRDGREGRFPIVIRDYWEVFIDGVSAEECFEELPYAG
ncbi:MAG: hypothetical protein BWY11_02508 [Firmicutes bacterium ADurb.Bin182]|nr:MAG: hypothetical protein BWY11_02508 [Firmicutes bacterium ADurb.Bin182]